MYIPVYKIIKSNISQEHQSSVDILHTRRQQGDVTIMIVLLSF